MEDLAGLTSALTFIQSCDAALDYLAEAMPMGHWSVSRFDGTDQVFLAVRDTCYGQNIGDHQAWTDSLCQFAVTGAAPRVAPDAMVVPQYAALDVARRLDIGSYVSAGIYRPGGRLFGTLCGLDPQVRSEEWAHHDGGADPVDLLDLLASLLGTILEADTRRTDQARRLERAQVLAETDALTGLFNRRGWLRFIALEEERYQRFADPGGVIMLDLDHLKKINDSAGHAAGDAYLRLAAETLRHSVRESDLVARLGGDEFAILATGSSPALTEALMGRLRSAMAAAGVSAAFGHASYKLDGGLNAACEAADAAMYLEKRRRRRENTQPGRLERR